MTEAPEIQVRHKREQRTTVVTNALANGACQLIVAPIPHYCFRIASDIGSVHLPRETLEHIHVLARAEGFREQRRIMRCPVVFCVAPRAVTYIQDQVLAASQALRRGLKLPCRE